MIINKQKKGGGDLPTFISILSFHIKYTLVYKSRHLILFWIVLAPFTFCRNPSTGSIQRWHATTVFKTIERRHLSDVVHKLRTKKKFFSHGVKNRLFPYQIQTMQIWICKTKFNVFFFNIEWYMWCKWRTTLTKRFNSLKYMNLISEIHHILYIPGCPKFAAVI